jgi:hypothetical protein
VRRCAHDRQLLFSVVEPVEMTTPRPGVEPVETTTPRPGVEPVETTTPRPVVEAVMRCIEPVETTLGSRCRRLVAVLDSRIRGVNSASQLPPATFHMRLPETKTALSVSTKRRRFDQVLRFKVKTTDERPYGFFPTEYADVLLQVAGNGKWQNLRGSKTTTDSRGRATIKVRATNDDSAVQVRAVTKRDDEYAGSESKVIRIRRAS